MAVQAPLPARGRNPVAGLSSRHVSIPATCLLIIFAFCVLEFADFLTSNGFGAEFCPFYGTIHGRPFSWVIAQYRASLGSVWYRPTSYFMAYWIGDQFLNWHSPPQWRAYELLTLFAAAAGIFWLVHLLARRRWVAGLFAAIYYLANPVVFAPAYDIAGFDFLYVVFGILSVGCYILALRTSGLRSVLLTIAAWIGYAIGATAKELILPEPLYLALLSGLSVYTAHRERAASWMPGARREVLRLLPFGAIPIAFWMLHMRQVAHAFAGNADYRTGFVLKSVIQNVIKYPLWLSRIFYPTPDTLLQAAGYTTIQNTIAGVILLSIAVIAWRRMAREERALRTVGIVALAWVGVFLIPSVYSGGYLWHANLALVGVAILMGFALDYWTEERSSARRLAIAAVSAIMLLLARTDVKACIDRGVHFEAYRFGESALTKPPVPIGTLKGPSIVYIENPTGIAAWYFGAGKLFQYVYRGPRVEQRVIPTRTAIPLAECNEMLRSPGIYMFTYDAAFRWQDITQEMRAYCAKLAAEANVPPEIARLDPAGTRVGQAFNVQADGSSAFSIVGKGFQPGAILRVNGQTISTAFGNPGWVTAVLPPQLFSKPGDLRMEMVNPNGRTSAPAAFHVRP